MQMHRRHRHDHHHHELAEHERAKRRLNTGLTEQLAPRTRGPGESIGASGGGLILAKPANEPASR